MGRLREIYQELTRRRVFRALLAWGIFAFAILQVVEPILHALDARDWVLKAVVAVLVAGFPVTAVLSWLFDLTAQGITRTPPARTEVSPTVERMVGRRSPGAVGTPAGEGPGPLSALLVDLARAPDEAIRSAWEAEPRQGDHLGRYEIRRELGRGGFGAVYEAQDLELGRHVAVKTLQPRRSARQLSSDWIHREAEAVAHLDHPCIVTLYDVGTAPAGPYLVMELLRGESLSDRLKRGPLSPRDALHVARQVARGLAHAHGRGILHRDLKPANVFLCEDGRVKLLDFGLAHLLGASGEGGSGTPGYMAPEQARGDDIDARADVFAAAMTLNESLTGRREAAVGSEVPSALRLPLERALSRDRAARPRDGTAWLEEVVDAERRLQRPRKVARAAALALSGVAVAAALTWMAWRQGRGSAPVNDGAPSVAVLPFVDLSPGHDQGHVADGIADEVISGIAQVDGVRVIGRTTSFSYRGKDRRIEDIGRELGVGAVLEGSVRTSGSRVRVTAQLVRAGNGTTLWSQSFDRDIADVFAMQGEIARSVVEALRVRLLPGQTVARSGTTTNPEALQHYLRGRDLLRRGPRQAPAAWEAFEKAVAADPRFALAWVGVADSVVTLEATMGDHPGDPAARRRRARKAADDAVRLAPDLADAHRARADVHQWLEGDWRGQREDLERARALAPGDAAVALSNGFHLLAIGRVDDSIAELERATRIDPLLERGWMNGWLALGSAYYSRRDHAGARRAAGRAEELFPDFRELPLSLRGMDLVVAGESREALELARTFREMGEGGASWALLFEAMALGEQGKGEDARRAFEELRRRWGDAGGAYQVAEASARMGDVDEAFRWLEKAWASRDTALFWLKTDPLLDKVRGDPRWPALLARAGLPPDGAPVEAGRGGAPAVP